MPTLRLEVLAVGLAPALLHGALLFALEPRAPSVHDEWALIPLTAHGEAE